MVLHTCIIASNYMQQGAEEHTVSQITCVTDTCIDFYLFKKKYFIVLISVKKSIATDIKLCILD